MNRHSSAAPAASPAPANHGLAANDPAILEVINWNRDAYRRARKEGRGDDAARHMGNVLFLGGVL